MSAGRRMVYLLDPTGEGGIAESGLAPGVPSLEGLRWGLLDNQKVNAGTVLEVIREAVEARHRVAEVRRWAKRIQSAAAPESMLDEIARSCDVVVHGVGD